MAKAIRFPPRPITRQVTAKEAVAGAHRRFPKIMAVLAEAEAREMTGFLATLTDEQKEAVKSYRGEENHG